MSVAIEKTTAVGKERARASGKVPRLVKNIAAPGWIRSLLVCIALFVLLLVPRLSELNALVTPDEPLWIARSANFYRALSDGDLRETYQYVHPGVPLMWLGTLGYFLHVRDMPDLMGEPIPVRNRAVQDVLESNGYPILDVLVELRQVVIVVSALVVLGLFLCLTRVVDFWAAAATIAFLSLDPMHIGFTRLLHLDGLSANLVLLSVVAFCWYLQSKSRTALIVTGVVTGIACLTRTANAVVGPFFALIALVDVGLVWRSNRTGARALLRRYGIALAVIGAITFAVFCVLWPAMWVAPIDTLSKLWSGSRDLTAQGSDLDLYFRGTVSSDPGWRFYPVVLAHRLSAFTVAGIAIALVASFRPTDLGERFNRRLAAHLGAFATIYVLILSASPKKLDRYVLPSVVALDIVAGLAWVAAAVWLSRTLFRSSTVRQQWTALLLFGVVLLGQTDYALQMRPFYIDAASPLFGGVQGAQEDFSFSWGEGGKEIAEALLKIPGIENAKVAAGPLQTTIDYYLPFRLNGPEYGSNLRTALVWMNTDYVVVSLPEIQRELYSPKLLTWFDQQQPVSTVTTIDGVYVRIYDIRNTLPPDSFYSNVPKAIWDGNATVLAADYPDSRSAGGESINVTLYIQTEQPSRAVRIRGQIATNEGAVIGSTATITTIAPGADGIAKVEFNIPIPADIDPLRYRIRYEFLDVTTEQPLPVVNEITGVPEIGPIGIGTVLIKPPKATS